ncbi:unnamed protein product [Penicillium pancosmium]
MTCANLTPLPFELWGCIAFHLSNADIKSLRLTCTLFYNAVPLRLDRVFLSANPLNIEVFRNIASHKKFRHSVTEVIWDEARLPRGPKRLDRSDEGHELLSDEDEPSNAREWAEHYHDYFREKIMERHEYDEESACPIWFKEVCEENLRIIRSRKCADKDRPEHIACREQILAQPPLKQCWKHYQHLLRQQKDVLAGDSDYEAFLFGVKQFPALKRVTITPAAHGYLFSPLYPTPMIRAFPKGFNYPIPYGWLLTGKDKPATAYAWNHYLELRARYRGFSTVMRVLANEPNSVSELVMTSSFLPTGINCTMFDEPCEEYDQFVKVLKNPGFRRLDISLLVGGEDESDLEPCWRSLRNGHLRHALSGATGLKEFRLHTTFDEDIHAEEQYPLISLNEIVPVDKWSDLRHFELSGFVISEDDCISFLPTLSRSIRSIELSMMEFYEVGDWYRMLKMIRRMVFDNSLGGGSSGYGRVIWVEKEVENFIYYDGENPFKESAPLKLPYGTGTVKDLFDPYFERPNVGPSELIRLGICRDKYDVYTY